VFCQPTQENDKEEDLLHMDFSQDFADELPEIHVGKTDEVTSIVEKYIGDDITPYIWTKILFAFIYSNCHLSLVDSLEALKNPNITISKDPALQLLLDAFQMMENNFTSVDAVLLRNLSSCMVKFTSKVGDDENDSPHTWGMRERVTSNETTNYFKGLLLFLLHIKHKYTVDLVEKLRITHLSAEQIHKQMLVPKLMYHLAREIPSNPGSVVTYNQYNLVKCFKMDASGNISLLSYPRAGSLFSTGLYIIREGNMFNAISMVHMNKTKHAEDMVIQVQACPVIQNLSKWIQLCKSQPKVKQSFMVVSTAGDLSLKGIKFKKQHYSNLIPNLKQHIYNCLNKIIADEEWKHILQGDGFELLNDWIHGNIIYVYSDNQREIPFKNLKLVDPIPRDSLCQLNAYMQLVFLGCGGGGERFNDINRMEVNQIWANTMGSDIYYHVTHVKQAAVTLQMNRQPAPHKLPPSLIPYFFLFRYITSSLHEDTRSNVPMVFLQTVNESDFSVKDAVSKLFGIGRKDVDLSSVRQLWTSIANTCLGNHSHSATGSAATTSNHTEKTHQRNYMTLDDNFEEQFYSSYHKSLGECPVQHQMSICTISNETMDHSLQILCGKNAVYRHSEQADMCKIACNSYGKHKFYLVEPGGGKTLSLLMPLVSAFISNHFIGIRILVLPYNFLATHQYSSIKQKLNDAFGTQIKVHMITGHSIPDSSTDPLPKNLMEDNHHVLITTIDGMAKILQHHCHILHSWKQRGLLRGIYIDEIQTIFQEYNFRSSYESLSLLSSIGVDVHFLSGTFPTDFILPMMLHLQLVTTQQSYEDIDVVESNATLKPDSTYKIIELDNDNIITKVSNLVLDRLQQSNSPIHIICRDKKDAEALYNQVISDTESLKYKVGFATSDTNQQDLLRTCDEWYDTSLDILITTTVGLVGNENWKCKTVLIFKCIYSLANLIQAMGRLRPEQRGADSMIIQVVSKECTNRNSFYCSSIRRTQEDLFRQFMNNGLLRDTDDIAFKKWFHIDAYIKLLTSNGCFLKTLSFLLYDKEIACCNRCNHCNQCTVNPYRKEPQSMPVAVTPYKPSVSTTTLTNNSSSPVRLKAKRPIYQYENPNLPSKKAMTTSNVDRIHKNTADKKYQSLLQSLKEKCYYCKSHICDGLKCVPYNKCSECLSTQHKVKDCPYQSKSKKRKELNDWLIQRQICIFCFIPYKEVNHEKPCPWSNRVKRMVVTTNSNLPLIERVQKVHASQETFKTWMSNH
jgi:hypothetical protein